MAGAVIFLKPSAESQVLVGHEEGYSSYVEVTRGAEVMAYPLRAAA